MLGRKVFRVILAIVPVSSEKSMIGLVVARIVATGILIMEDNAL